MSALEREISGEVRVASRIVDYLSSGLYDSPAACLKELINNSYDADASTVHLSVKPSALTVTIEDDGEGLDADEFERHFQKIADSMKREGSDRTEERGRPKIGKIGIGFIAANELCERMRIESSRRGSEAMLDVTVDFKAMREDPADRRDENGTLKKGDYFGEVATTDVERRFTRITLMELRPLAQQALIRTTPEVAQQKVLSLYGLGPSSVADALSSTRLKSWSELDQYSRNMLEIGLNVPVRYHDHWLGVDGSGTAAGDAEIERRFAERAAEADFSVIYDGSDLRKPVVLREQKDEHLTRLLDYQGDEVSFGGYLFASHGIVQPTELQGVLVRIRDAAVGRYSSDLLGFPRTRASLLQRWISGEIYASDELEEAMNIDRVTMRTTHPAYVEMKTAFHEILGDFISDVRRELYERPSDERRQEAAEAAGSELIDQLKDLKPAPIPKGSKPKPSSPAADSIKDALDRDPASFVRKMAASDLYAIVVRVADESLDPKQRDAFLSRLAETIFAAPTRKKR